MNRKEQGNDNFEWGHMAEQVAVEYLLGQSYVIRERNWKCGHLEIDIIAQVDRTVIFIEVKARSGKYEKAIEAVDARKQARIIHAADIYLRNLTHLYQYRFDVIALTGNRDNFKLEHYRDAFMPKVNGGRRW